MASSVVCRHFGCSGKHACGHGMPPAPTSNLQAHSKIVPHLRPRPRRPTRAPPFCCSSLRSASHPTLPRRAASNCTQPPQQSSDSMSSRPVYTVPGPTGILEPRVDLVVCGAAQAGYARTSALAPTRGRNPKSASPGHYIKQVRSGVGQGVGGWG